MADVKVRRQRAIADLVRSQSVANQDDLAERLGASGFTVTQATISRDLEELGAVKIRKGEGAVYTMPDQLASSGWARPQLAAITRDWVRSIEPAGNLLVIRTPPGSAHLLGVALDQAEIAEVVGTICGDDTIFIATKDSAAAVKLASQLRTMGMAGE